MPQDVNCPKCKHLFPVAEARQAFGVQCPSCDMEFTAEFRKVPAPAPGEPPYELLVSNGKPAAMLLEAKKKAKGEDEEKVRQGGSMTMVVVVAVSALFITLGVLGFTGYYLFTHTDTTEYVSTGGGNRPSNNNNNNNNRPNNNPGPKINVPNVPQQPPKTVFTDFNMDRWKFRAKFPGKPQEQTQNGAGGSTTTFILESRGGIMMIAVSDLQLPAKMTLQQTNDALDGAMNGIVKGMAGNIQNSKQSSTGGGNAKIYIREINASIGNPRPGLMRTNLYLAGTRLYQVTVMGEREYVDHEDATTFLKSFSITR